MLNPGTDPEVLRYALDMCDLILVMSVNPGFGGQSFIESQVDKIKTIRAMCDEAGVDPWIEVDGGVGPANGSTGVSPGAASPAAPPPSPSPLASGSRAEPSRPEPSIDGSSDVARSARPASASSLLPAAASRSHVMVTNTPARWWFAAGRPIPCRRGW